MTTVEQLEDRVVSLEEFSRDVSVELRNITYRLDDIDRKLSVVETGMERIESVQIEHTERFDGIDQRFDGIDQRFESLEAMMRQILNVLERR